MSLFGAFPSILLAVALFLVFVGERVLGLGGLRDLTLALGGVTLLTALVLRAMAVSRAPAPARKVEIPLLVASVGVAVALGLYALSTDSGVAFLGLERDVADRASGLLFVAAAIVVLLSMTSLLFIELTYRRMPIAEAVEPKRVRNAALGGIGLALSFVFLASMNFVSSARDVRRDFSYFKTTRPSEGTLAAVKKLGEPLRVILFFPRVNEVLDQVEPYFRELAQTSSKLKIEVVDHALAPELARAHKVSSNGRILLVRGKDEGAQTEQVTIGTTLEEARSNLKKLDGSFQLAFMRLTRKRRELYLTVGHDERNVASAAQDDGERTTGLTAGLQRSNIATRDFGISEGLASSVPEDVPAVAVIGPRSPFMEEEARSLLRYVQAGGRVLVMMDPDANHGLEPLLAGLGLRLLPGILASDRDFVRRTSTPADRTNVFSNRFTSHPVVTTPSRFGAQVASIFVRAGALDRVDGPEKLKGVSVAFPLRTSNRVFRDLNGNFEQDEGEALEESNVIAAVTVPTASGQEGRAVVIADGDFVTDQLVRNPGNSLLFGDAMNWLIGEEQIVGDATSEEDVRIEHTRDEDKVWFYATSFGVPFPFLGIGIYMAVRRRRRSPDGKARAQGGGAR